MTDKTRRKAFTLVELLVVIAIIGLLSTIAVANMSSARQKARIAAQQQSDTSYYHKLGAEIIADWSLDATTTSVSDTSGNGYDGTLAGTVTGSTYTSGVYGGGIYFDGSTNYIQPAKQITIYYNSFTASAWFKTNAAGGTPYILSGGEGVGHPIGLINGALRFCTTATCTNGTKQFNDNDWHFAVVTGDGTSIRGYVDGALQFTQAASASAATASYAIGKDANPSIYFYQGALDQVRLYGLSTTAQAVQKMYALGKISHQ